MCLESVQSAHQYPALLTSLTVPATRSNSLVCFARGGRKHCRLKRLLLFRFASELEFSSQLHTRVSQEQGRGCDLQSFQSASAPCCACFVLVWCASPGCAWHRIQAVPRTVTFEFYPKALNHTASGIGYIFLRGKLRDPLPWTGTSTSTISLTCRAVSSHPQSHSTHHFDTFNFFDDLLQNLLFDHRLDNFFDYFNLGHHYKKRLSAQCGI